MHLVIFGTLLSYIAITFALPLTPVEISSLFATPSSVSEPNSWSDQRSYTQHSHPTTLSTHDIHPSSGHHHLSSKTHGVYQPTVLRTTFARPTGTSHHSIIAKPTHTAAPLYVRDTLDLALTGRDEEDTEGDCQLGCSRAGCWTRCPPGKVAAGSVLTGRSEAEANLALYLRNFDNTDKPCHPICSARGCMCPDENDTDLGQGKEPSESDTNILLTGRNTDLGQGKEPSESDTDIFLAGRDVDAAGRGCQWACFGTACECIPVNASGKSATLSKAFAGLVIIVAAAVSIV